MKAARKCHIRSRIENCANTKQLYTVSNELHGKSKTMPLPSDIPHSKLPDRFCTFLSQKIQTIRDELMLTHMNQLHSPSAMVPNFVILSLSQKTKFANSFLNLVNSYLAFGIVPHQYKQAVVTPLLKKPGLGPNDLKHFRPVSNLPFIYKIPRKSCISSTPETPLRKQSHRKSAVRLQKEP